MIRLENVHKSFGTIQVLKGISLSVPGNSIAAIVGGPGTGKSLLLRLMSGLEVPDAGSVIIDGEDLVGLRAAALDRVRRRFGFQFQDPALFSHLTVGENVAFALRSRLHLPESEIRGIVLEKLADVGLLGQEEKFPDELDMGAQRRTGLARALALDPEIVLLDEPTLGLDPVTGWYVMNLIVRTHLERPVTSVIVTQDAERFIDVSDQVLLVYQGRIVATGSPEEIRNDADHLIRRYMDRSFGWPVPARGRTPDESQEHS
ncbi:MAG: ATP-binding cassette domain-containing protein [Thermodesulfobacteriota bacterium]